MAARLVQLTRVMLVDDHRLMRDVLGHLLSLEPDMDVVGTAADGEVALELVRYLRPHVVVMDIGLPGIDGIETTRTLHEMLPAVRVVMLSASCSRRMVEESVNAGACGFLLKGDAAHHLPDGIRAVVRGAQPLAALARALWS